MIRLSARGGACRRLVRALHGRFASRACRERGVEEVVAHSSEEAALLKNCRRGYGAQVSRQHPAAKPLAIRIWRSDNTSP